MAISKLLYPSIAFLQDKLLPTLEEGLSRIELSNYFNSWDNYRDNIGAINSYRMQIDSALDALNRMRDKLYFKVPLQLMINSYFTFCRT